MKKIFLFLLSIALSSVVMYAQTTVVSANSGEWNEPSTWVGGVIPGCFNIIEISTGNEVNISNAVILTLCADPIYIDVMGKLTLGCPSNNIFGAALTIPVGSAINIQAGGVLKGCDGVTIVYSGTWGPGSGILYTSDSGIVTGPRYLAADTSVSLPVELISFNSNVTRNKIIVNWQTATETNSDYFQVERSSDGVNWERMDELVAAGNSNTVLNYQYIDKSPISDITYYRLLQMDFDGEFEYYGPIVARIENTGLNTELSIFPNPNSEGQLNISIGKPMQNGDIIEVFDNTGRLLMSSNVSSDTQTFQLNVSELKKGMYIIRYQSRDAQLTERLIIQ